MGSSIAEASRPETQGVGPYSSADYRNGSDIESDNYVAPVSGSGLRLGGASSSGLRFGDSAVAAWGGEVDARIKDGARAWANWDTAYGEYTAKQDAEAAARAQAELPGQHARADAYRRELTDAAQRAKWDAMQVGAWSGRTNQLVAPSVTAAAATMEVPQYDAMGNYTGTTVAADASPPSMGYGEQMRNVGRFSGDLGIGAVKGLDNLIPETAAFAYRMTGYAAAGVTSLFNTDVSDRMFAQYSRVTGRIFDYDNGVQEFGGIAAQLAAPTIFKGVSASGSALYELELRAKTSFNYDYRHYLSGTTVLNAETTFYSYKNSAYFTPGATFEPTKLWLTPELMTSQEAVQRLALPRPTGYNTLLSVTLPEGTSIMTPRPVWSLFGRPGGGVETRVYAPVTSDMYLVSPAPTKVPK